MSELKTTQHERDRWIGFGDGDEAQDIATLQQQLAEAQAQNAGLEMRVRHLLWSNHGHIGTYGDDGEMQCAECAKYGAWDYKNAPMVEVEAAYRLAVMERAALNAPAQEEEKP